MKELVFKLILMTLGLVIITSCSNNETSVKIAEPEHIEVNSSKSETQCPNCNGRGYNIRYKTIYEPEMNETRIVTGRIPSKKNVEVRENCTLCSGAGRITNQKTSSNFFDGASAVPAEPDKIENENNLENKFEQTEIISAIEINGKLWATKNLDVDRFRNGEFIPEAKTAEEWRKAGKNKQPAWCYYNNDPLNGKRYGKLYNWYAVNDPRGLAPDGWHIPSDEEFLKCTNFLGAEEVSATWEGMSINGWKTVGDGINSGKFLCPPSGYRDVAGGFDNIGYYGSIWVSTQFDSTKAWQRGLNFKENSFFRYEEWMRSGSSVRCIKD